MQTHNHRCELCEELIRRKDEDKDDVVSVRDIGVFHWRCFEKYKKLTN